MDEISMYSVVEGDEGLLGVVDHPKRLREAGGFGMVTTGRNVLQRRLVEFAEKNGVCINWGHQLETFEQNEDNVLATFSNGVQESFSFIVGCDGLHSNVRKCLFGDQPARYLGISQVCIYVD